MDADAPLAALAAARFATVADLRAFADRLEHLALRDAAELLVRLAPAFETLRREAARAFERAPRP